MLRLTVGFLLVSLCSTVTLVIALLLLPWRPARVKLCNYYGKIVGRAILWLAGATPTVHHRERVEQYRPAIYVSNHVSTLDAFVAIWICPIGGCGVAKKEILRIPFFGWLYYLSGHLTIDRGDRGSAIAAMKDTAEFVRRNGLSIWIWPEGTRSKDGRLQPLKKGFAHLALATKLPIVPVVVHRAHENWAKHTFMFQPIDLKIEILPAISTESWRPETLDAHLAEVHKAFADQLDDDQKPLVPQSAAAQSSSA
jgi:1-acyl-sn-glycerol-3-phosphate acyltransferase